MFEYGQEGLFFIIRIIATIGGAVVGWFVCEALTRIVYRLIYREPAPGFLIFSFKVIGAISLALAIYFLMPLGGSGGLGQGAGKGGLPGKGPGKGGDKSTDPAKKDDNPTLDPKLEKPTPNGKTPTTREMVLIEVLGGERFPTDGKDRYYLLKKADAPVALSDLEDYFKKHAHKLEIKIIHTDDSTVINTDMDPTRRLQKLASKYDLPSVVIGPP